MPKPIIKYAFVHALCAATYIGLVALAMNLISQIRPPIEKSNATIFITAFLLTFVISAAVMGLLIFARPIMWYLNGQKKEALTLTLYTIGFLILIALFVFTILLAQISY